LFERKGRMKTFLTAWLGASSEILARELAGKLELRPSARLPQPETAMTLAVVAGGAYTGRFCVTVDRYALQALLAGARITDGSVDTDRDRELWRGMLHQVANAAVPALDAAKSESITITVEDGEWALGMPSAAYEVLFGEVVVPMAFTDQVHVSQIVENKMAQEVMQGHQAEPASPTSPKGETAANPGTQSSQDAGGEPGRIDLLLGVELEASLRFGSREMPLSAVLDLGAGDVVELDRHVSDPVDLLVGDKIVARGEVVLVNGAFGLRVLEVAEPKKRLESIRCLF
jgi:flagellar motor switch protein FliN